MDAVSRAGNILPAEPYIINISVPKEGEIIPLDHEKLIQEWEALNKWNFIKENMTKKSVAKTAMVATFAFFSPGMVMRMSGMLVPQLTLWAEMTNIASASWTCWKNPFVITDLGVMMAQFGAGYWLYKELTKTALPTSTTFQAWKIDRISIFQKIHMIPEEYEDHPWFEENNLVCAITTFPIRFPVYELTKDSKGNAKRKYYEQSAICAWLAGKKTSPFTRQPLTVKDLIFDHDAAKKIEEKLAELQKNRKYTLIEGVF